MKRAGRRVSGRWFTLTSAPVAGQTRVGLTVSAHVGNAVLRNRVKRRLREFLRAHKDALPVADVVIVALAGVASRPWPECAAELAELCVCARRGGGSER